MDLLGSAITMRRLTFAFIIINSILLASVLIPTTQVSAASNMPKGSKVADVDVAKLTEDEIKQDFTNKITIWQTGEPILLKSNFEKIEIPRSAFVFDIDETIAQLEVQTKGSWKTLFRKNKNVNVPLVTTLDANDFATQYLHKQTHLNTDALEIELINIAKNLGESEISLTYDDESAIPFETIAEVEIDLASLPDHIIERAAQEIDGYTIEPESAVSYLKNLSIYSLLIDDIENTTVATGLYELFLQTNFEIVERHTSLHYDDKKETDVEAYVHQARNKDFVAHNPNDIAFILRAEPTKESMTLRLESTFDDASFDYEVKTKKIDYRTLYRYKKDLSPGHAEVLQAGKPGLDVKVEQSQYDTSEILESKTTIAHDTYLPVPQIVLTSSKPLVEERETYEEDNDSETIDLDEDESDTPYDDTGSYYDETDEWINDLNNDYLNDTQQVTGEERDKRIEELKENYASILDIWEEVFGNDDNDDATKEIKQLEKEIKKYQKDIKSLEKEIQKLIQNSKPNNDTNLDSIMQQLEAQQEQIAFLYVIIEQLELEQDDMRAKIKDLQTTIENHEASLETMKNKLDISDKEMKETLEKHEKELADLSEKLGKLLEETEDEDDEEKDEEENEDAEA